MVVKNKGFTLVELIVVITILAVLWSIAFISFQWYSASARDSARVADITNFRKWIEIYMAEAGEYPMPDSAVSTSWGGHIANYKGVVWALAKENSRISKVILDPVTSEKYEYSISGNKKEYEVKYNLEWPQEYALLSQAYAADFDSLRIIWNYNWVFARTDKNGFVAMPSLFSGETDVTIWTSAEFSLDNSKEKIAFTPTFLDSTSTETLITDLKTAYNSADPKVKETEKVVKILAMTASDEATQKEFEVDFLGSEPAETPAEISYSCTGSLVEANATITNNTGLTADVAYQKSDNSGDCYFVCKPGFKGGDCSTETFTKIVSWPFAYHTCGVTPAWSVKCWGYNNHGQLWDWTTSNRSTPVQVSGLTSWVEDITLWYYHTCALLITWGVKCWGHNSYGQLWDNSTTDRYTPVLISWLSSWVEGISLWYYHSCAMLDSWGIKCWGYNAHGELWDNSTTDRYTPVSVSWLSSWVEDISLWGFHSCSMLDSWGVKCWGRNYYGQLWDNSTTDRYTPVLISWLSSWVEDISLWYYHSCAMLDSWGIKCWGYNNHGQLWDNSTTNKYTPVSVSWLSSGVENISLWSYHSCTLLTSWGVKCWGYNTHGELWDNSTTDRYTPVSVLWLSSGVEDISLWYYHSCATLGTGEAKCWGYNGHGQLWDNSTTNRYTPVEVHY